MFWISLVFLAAAVAFALFAFGVVAVTWATTALILFVASLVLFVVLFIVAMLQRRPSV